MPSPGDSAHIRPPIASQSRCEIASPRPVPSYFLVGERSTCWKDLKMESMLDELRPIAGVLDVEVEDPVVAVARVGRDQARRHPRVRWTIFEPIHRLASLLLHASRAWSVLAPLPHLMHLLRPGALPPPPRRCLRSPSR